MSTPPAPGWHPDPWGQAHYRWWDGTTWTGDTAQGGTPTGSTQSHPTASYPTDQSLSGAALGGSAPPQPSGGSRTALLIVGGVVAVALLVAAGVLVAIRSGGDDDVTVAAPGSTKVTRPTPDGPTTTRDNVPSQAPTTRAQATDTTAPPATGGVATREKPAPLGSVVDLEDGWLVAVINVDANAAFERLDGEEPAPGSRYVVATVEALWTGGEDEPSSALFLTFGLVGSSNVSIDTGCGFVPGTDVLFRDVFVGGALTFPVCFEVPDSETDLVLFSDSFISDKKFLSLDGAPVATSGLVARPGPQPEGSTTSARLTPVPVGIRSDIGEGWSVAVTSFQPDVAALVLAENQFNDPPPEGHKMVFVNVEIGYDGPEESGNLFSPNFNAVGLSNLSYGNTCGVIPGELDYLTDIFPGGVITGALCFVVPNGEVDSLQFYASGGFTEEPVFFAVR